MPTDRMGPPPGASPPMRMTASWSGSTDPTAYKSVARKMCPNGELPSDSQQTDLQVPTRHRGMRKARLAVHHRSACSGVKALRNTSPLGGRPLLPFRSLDPFRPLREPDRRRRNEERLSRSEQRTGNKPKIRLDRKSPIQVRIHLPPAVSQGRTRPRGLALLEATIVSERPMMGVFNNLVVFDQHVKQNSLNSIVPDLADEVGPTLLQRQRERSRPAGPCQRS